MKSLPGQATEPSTLPVSRARKITRKVEAPAVEAVPLDQLRPAPWNPRTIKDERFQNLMRSIQADPDFLWRRPILATADGTIYAGNMRYRAAQQLGMGTAPAIIEDISERLTAEPDRAEITGSIPALQGSPDSVCQDGILTIVRTSA